MTLSANQRVFLKHSCKPALFDVDLVNKLLMVIETRWNPWFGLIRMFRSRSKTVLPTWSLFNSNQRSDSGKNKIRTTRIALFAPIITTKSLEKCQKWLISYASYHMSHMVSLLPPISREISRKTVYDKAGSIHEQKYWCLFWSRAWIHHFSEIDETSSKISVKPVRFLNGRSGKLPLW